MLYLKKVPNPFWTSTPTGDLKVKISKIWNKWQLKEIAFLGWQDQAFISFSCCCSLLCFSSPFSLGEVMVLSTSPSVLQKWVLDLSPETLICSQCQRPVLLFVTNFSLVPNTTADFMHNPMDSTHVVRLLQLGVSIPCFNLSPHHNHTSSTEHFYLCQLYDICSPTCFALPQYNLFPSNLREYKEVYTSLRGV